MIKYILFISLFTFHLIANSLIIEEKYFIDNTKSLTIKNIIETKNSFLTLAKYNFGISKNNLWIQLHIKNNSPTVSKKRISNRTSGIDLINVYITQKDKIQKTYSLGDFRQHQIRDNHFRTSYFDIELQPFQEVSIFIKQETHSNMDARWNIENINTFINYYNLQGMIYSSLFGILFIGTIVAFILYFLLKNKFYLIYAFFTIFSIIYQLTIAGFFYQYEIPIYINTIFGFSFPVFASVLLGIFPFYFFDLKKDEYRIFKNILKALIILNAIFALAELFYPFNEDLLYSAKYTNIVSFLLMLTLFIFSIIMFIDKRKGSIFYLISNIILFIFITSFLLVLSGLMDHCDFFYYTLASGTIGQDIFLGIALIHSTYLSKKDNDKNKQLLNEYSKLSFIGQTMINISHQWKTPINNIFNSINHIEVAREFEDENIDNIINKNLQNIKNTTIFLKDTALGQLDFYKSDSKKEDINLWYEISFLVNLIKNEFDKKDIKINFNFDKNLHIHIQKNYFLNVLMILFENSYKIFKEKKIEKPLIQIDVIIQKDILTFTFQDNAKGVSSDIDKIFEKNYSLSDSSGIGLYLAQEIIIYKLKGKISAINKNDGILFNLSIPLPNYA